MTDTTDTHPAALGDGKLRLAGMALHNGVLIIGPSHWAASIRTGDGEIVTTVRRRPTLAARLRRTGFVRGPLALAEMLAVLPALKRAMPAARLAVETPGVAAALVGGSVAGRLLRGRAAQRRPLADLASGALALGGMLYALRSSELAQYHGAEHKVVGGYERDIPAHDASKEHERCGTQLAVPMLLANVVATQGARLALPGRDRTAALAGSIAGMVLATEFARRTSEGGNGALGTAFARLGAKLQASASTREPTPEQLEVAQAAIAAVLTAEGSPVPVA